MRITIQQSIAGNANPAYDLPEFGFRPGETVEIHDVLAKAWIASGVAVKAKRAAAAPPQPVLDLGQSE